MAFLDETGLAELWALTRAADVKIATGSYVGTGIYDNGNAKRNWNDLTFDGRPKIVFVASTGTVNIGSDIAIFVIPDEANATDGFVSVKYVNETHEGVYAHMDGNTLLWRSTNSAEEQMNESETIYEYNAIFVGGSVL